MKYGGRDVAEWRLERIDRWGRHYIIRVSVNYERLARLERDRASAARGGDTFATVPHRYAGEVNYESSGTDTDGAPVFPMNWTTFVRS